MNDGGFWIQPNTLNLIELLMWIVGILTAMLIKIIINLVQDYKKIKRINSYIKLNK